MWYSVVVLEYSLEIKTIPLEFIRGFDPIRMANDDVDQSKTHIIFYLDNFNVIPNFDTELRRDFDGMVPGCY